MPFRIKTLLRDAIPPKYQVPLKYWYDVGSGHAEPEMALLPHLVTKGCRVADIGGNRGTYAYRLYRLGARLEVFEPNPGCAAILNQWANGKSDVQVHCVGLSNKSGQATLHVPIDAHGVEHDASASIDGGVEGESRNLKILIRDLDSYGFPDLNFIKIDTEGHEGNVLAGALSTIAVSRPAMLIEIEQRHNHREPIGEIFARIAALGYNGFFLRNGRLETIDCFDVQRDQSLAVFAGKDSAYLNNFLFLANDRLATGQYRSLTRTWMAK